MSRLVKSLFVIWGIVCVATSSALAVSCDPATLANTSGVIANSQLEVAIANCKNALAGNPVSATPYTFTPLSPMQSGLAVTSSTALTVPAGATYAVVCAYGQTVNYTTDGSATPTGTSSGVGMQLAAGSCLPLSGPLLISNFRAIQQSATATLSVSYFR